MKELTKEELKQISGGGISATLVNTFLDVGRSFGSAIRRMIEKNVCPI